MPRFNIKGDKVAWLEQAEEGNGAAHTYVVVYNLEEGIRYNLADTWDRSPDSIAVRISSSSEGQDR
jgi:hypothetical protein